MKIHIFLLFYKLFNTYMEINETDSNLHKHWQTTFTVTWRRSNAWCHALWG